MKEIISAVIFLVGIASGTAAIKAMNETIKKAALEKASQGMPSLQEMNRKLRSGK